MRRRFGRGRRRGSAGDGKDAPIDAARTFEQIVESGAIGATQLQPIEVEGVSPSHAALAIGEDGSGGDLVVGFSRREGGDAALAALALARQREAQEGFAGTVFAIAPWWSTTSLRRLGLIGALPFVLRPEAIPGLADGEGLVQVERDRSATCVLPRQLAGLLERDSDRDLFQRALAGLEGLAAKHNGVVRAVGTSVELVVLARCVAQLQVEPTLALAVLLPERAELDLAGSDLSTALDRLEGLLRKRLNDRRVRGSDEGLRTDLLGMLSRAADARQSCRWPLPGSDPEVLDLLGLRADGGLVAAAAREHMTLERLGPILDGLLQLRALAPLLLADAGAPVRPGTPELLLAAREYDDVVLAALSTLIVPHAEYDVVSRRGRELALERREGPIARMDVVAAAEPLAEAGEALESESPPRAVERERRPRRRGGRRGGRRNGEEPVRADEAEEAERDEAEAMPSPASEASGEAEAGPRFEEVSLFDLEDEGREEEESDAEAPRRRRGRGRRRGRRGRGAAGAGDGAEASGEETSDGDGASGRGRGRASRRAAEAEEPELEDDEELVPLADDVPEIDAVAVPAYEDEEEEEEGDSDDDRARRERELRRRARIAKAAPALEPEEVPRPPRRRAAILAHADRVSVLTAVLLARDVRLVEGFWVYPQEDLMTFFRSIATDLREETPIFLVGFSASPPARDTIQAASLYRDRLDWFDHHSWPPEDIVSLGASIGEEHVHILPGAESSLAAVLAQRTRRSRFSDKLVELATGRFSRHDYERWGRLWWHRIGEIASRPGERRAEIDPLLAGRPSDLAKEAATVPVPPVPLEVEFVSARDFRLVHFGGYALVVVPVAADVDLHLAARVAREHYEAQISLSYREGEQLLVLGGDEGRGRRGLDLGSMTEHLAAKHEWIEALPDDDHVARMRVHGLWDHPERLDEVIGEIAMGRSIVEG